MHPPYIADQASVRIACDLMTTFGAQAAPEAEARAEHGATLGNVTSFCRWRQIARLIAVLGDDRAIGTVH